MALTRISSAEIVRIESDLKSNDGMEAISIMIFITCLITLATVSHYWVTHNKLKQHQANKGRIH